MYLYLTQKDKFDQVPEPLMKAFGEPEFAMQLNLAKRDRLAREDINVVKEKLQEVGYFLQMPPPTVPLTTSIREQTTGSQEP